MEFRYHETGSYFVTKTFTDLFKANDFIKQEESREKSEIIDFKILEYYGQQN